jgi:hypothetical protein
MFTKLAIFKDDILDENDHNSYKSESHKKYVMDLRKKSLEIKGKLHEITYQHQRLSLDVLES